MRAMLICMTRLGDALTKKISKLLRRGWSKQSVCAKTGISTSSFDNWGKKGREMLEKHEYCKEDAIIDIKTNTCLSESDRRSLTHQVNFAFCIQKAVGEQVGLVEETAYLGALEDSKSAIAWLERRASGQWSKPIAPPVVVETHPIKQIIIHAGEGDVKQLSPYTPTDAEYEDV